MSKLVDKKVLITGAASGIGFCTAQQFAKARCELILTDINSRALTEAATKIRETGAKAHTFVVDVSRQKQVEEMAAQVRKDVGHIDILINNAGIGYHGELTNTSLRTWRQLLNVNFWGPLYHVYTFLPQMKEQQGGQIVNISSGQAFFRLPTWGAYAAIKAALGVFSEVLHFELRKHGIRVTTVYPFMVNTPFYSDITGDTLVGRLSMKLLPYYSMTPEKVGQVIFNAVKRKKKVEFVSILNDIGFYAQCVPLAPDIISRAASFFLGGHAKASS